jgi:hypothetical protein
MTAAKHTPGPWHIDAGVIKAGDVRERVSIGIVFDWSENAPEEAAANARLIAAAPELLDALRALVFATPYHIKTNEKFNAAWRRANDLVAKTTGSKS